VSNVRLSDFIKAYDVRGLVPEQLSPAVARAIGMAFADVVVAERGDQAGVVIGYDMRPSSPELADAFAQGVACRGHDVTVIGLCSTDGLYYASGALDQAGAMFTASHNPAEYNGIKLCRPGAAPVGQDSGLAELTTVAQGLLEDGLALPDAGPTPQRAAGTISHRPMLGEYAQYLNGLVDLRTSRPLRVVVDAGNGMAGLTVPAVLGDLPLTVIPMYFELDGTFPNHEANPLDPANLVDLQRAVVEHRADLGLAFDGDADRCFVVDERGRPVSPSAITALVATREIAKHVAQGGDPGQVSIVYNVISSAAVPQIVAEHGARAVRTRVGHSFIKARMAQEQAVFGGEHSAHYYFREFWYADTGMLAALHVLAALGEQDGSLSELVAAFARFVASGEINSRVAHVDRALTEVRAWAQAASADVDALDGLTVTGRDEPMWWFNVRPSNTEPLLRLNVEAADQDTMERIRDSVLGIIRAGQADHQGEAVEPPMGAALPDWLREILVCPAGRHPLADAVGPGGVPELVCTQDCGAAGVRRGYRIEDGIPILLLDEARLIEHPESE
jgi:phosphomannomutase